jgi:hypothetical protein
LRPAEDNRCDGVIEGVSHVHHRRAMTAAHDRHILNFQRYARDHPDPAAVTGYDAIQSDTNGAVPVSLHGGCPVAIPPYREAAPIVVAGAPSNLSAEKGQVAWNSTAMTVHRKLGGAGVGFGRRSTSAFFRPRLRADGANGRRCDDGERGDGTALRIAPLTADDGGCRGGGRDRAAAAYLHRDGHDADDVPAGAGAARDAGDRRRRYDHAHRGGVLMPGMQRVHAWTSNAVADAGGSLCRCGGGRATFALHGRGMGVSLHGRESHGLPNGQQIAGAMLVRIDSLATVPFLTNLSRGPGGQMSFAVRVPNDGRLSFVGNNNAASPTLWA